MTTEMQDTEKSQEKETSGVVGMVLEGVLAAIRGWFDAARASVEQAITDTVMRAARQAFVFFLALLGIAFLLFGLAKTLSFLFRTPGIGEMIVGFIVLAMAFILSLFTRGRK
ncbi:MAG: hypothetical protein KBC83_03230 [Candidatus Moranbacteria bacterium]|jgi:hypothetical protein|nr:hypothetical protein [Candidatus Moranbacteria bacterium]MBP9801648.1 hypothetical protein [Candidatus Moranbacteria bacterium]